MLGKDTVSGSDELSNVGDVARVLVRVAKPKRRSTAAMNTEIARTHVCALIDGHLDEATADKLFADSDFIRLEIEKVISKVSTAAAGRPITGEIQEAGLQQYTEEFLARLQQQYPRNFQDD